MDTLDPITEIIKSGQAFSSSIAIERIIWLMMGIFFLGAISKSITRGMREKNWFGNRLFLHSLKAVRGQDKISNERSH